MLNAVVITKDKSLNTSFQIFPSETLFYAQIMIDSEETKRQ